MKIYPSFFECGILQLTDRQTASEQIQAETQPSCHDLLGTAVPLWALCASRGRRWSPPTPLCKPRTFILSSLQHVKLRPTRVFVRRPARLELTCWKCAEIDIYSHLQTLSKDDSIRADYAFSALERERGDFFRLVGYTSVLSNYNSNYLTFCVQMAYEQQYLSVRSVWLISTLRRLAMATWRVTFVAQVGVTLTLTLLTMAMELSASSTRRVFLAPTHSTSSSVDSQCPRASSHNRYHTCHYVCSMVLIVIS